MGFFSKFFVPNEEEKSLILVVAVGMYADRKVNIKEMDCAMQLVSDFALQDRKTTDVLFHKIEKRIKSYEKDFGAYIKDKTLLVHQILELGKWHLGAILEKVIKSDEIVTSEESELLNRVIECVRAREAVLQSLKHSPI